MLPVFSLVLDTDVSDDIALQYPELYRELQKGRALNMRTFLLWCFQSVYQVASPALQSCTADALNVCTDAGRRYHADVNCSFREIFLKHCSHYFYSAGFHRVADGVLQFVHNVG